MKAFFIIILSLISISLFSQNKNTTLKPNSEEEKTDYSGWQFGGNMGMYFANKNTANYYNGARVDNNAYNLDSTLLERVINNPFNQKQIRDALGGYNYKMGEYATGMKYQPAMTFGVFARYQVDETFGIFGQFNYSKIKTSDFFTIYLDKYNNGFTEPYIYTANISGSEERINIDLGFSLMMKTDKKIYPYFEVAANLSEVTAKESNIKIETLEYSIMSPYNQMYNIKEGGLGIGGLVSAGYHIEFNSNFLFDIGPTLYISKIHLGDYPKYAMNGMLQLRIIFV
ncbi:MAG: hypothetical protein WCK02_08585 [Bacteroidota bacterium]